MTGEQYSKILEHLELCYPFHADGFRKGLLRVEEKELDNGNTVFHIYTQTRPDLWEIVTSYVDYD